MHCHCTCTVAKNTSTLKYAVLFPQKNDIYLTDIVKLIVILDELNMRPGKMFCSEKGKGKIF